MNAASLIVASSLYEEIDSNNSFIYVLIWNNNDAQLLSIERVLVVMRDGRKLIGILRSFDQFGLLFSLNLKSHYLNIRISAIYYKLKW